MAHKVCHVTSVHGRHDTRIFIKECTSLANAGYDVTLLVADNKPDEVRNGVKITSIDFHPKNRFDRILHSVNAMLGKAVEIDAEIYHLHDPELLPLGKKLKKQGKKVIFDCHESFTELILTKKWMPKLLRKPVSLLCKKYSANVMLKFDALITVTPWLVDKLKSVNINTVMVSNYPVCMDYNEVEANKYDPPTLVFAGGITEQWNHEIILKAIEDLEVKYLLMGKVLDDNYLEKLKNYSAWDKVEFLGNISHENVLEKMKRCCAGLAIVTPSVNSGGILGTLGNTKLFEQMQAGLPVICTDFVLWKEIIDKWNCGICINPSSVKELTSAIRYLLDNPDEARKMGENGRKAIKEEFNWSIEEKKLLKLYEGLKKERVSDAQL